MFIPAALLALAPLAQTESTQSHALRRAQRFLDAERCAQAALHAAEHEFDEALHTRTMALARELHLAEMAHDMGIAQREAVRDDWAQHSLYREGLMMMSSLIFAVACAILCEAAVPPRGGPLVAMLFAVLCGVGVSSSLMSLWLGMKVQSRMAEFDFHAPTARYSCGRSHFEFSDYHACHCSVIEGASLLLFLLSIVSTAAAGCVSFGAVVSVGWTAGAGVAGVVVAAVAVAIVVIGSFVGYRSM